jgi:chromosome segregation ATPase
MSTTGKKIPATGGIGRRSLDPALSPTAPARTPARSSTPTSSAATNGGLARTRSLRGSALSARTPAQRSSAGASNLSLNSSASEADEEARAESIALLDDLRERLHVAEVKAENYQKENEVLQSRLDDELNDQAKLEDKIHEKDERLELQENDKRDASRQMREMESIYEAERVAMTREKEEMANREEEMQAIIQRLKDSLSQKANGDDENRPFRCMSINPPLADKPH